MQYEYAGPRSFIGAYVAPDIKLQLVEQAQLHRVPLSEEIRAALEGYLGRVEIEEPQPA